MLEPEAGAALVGLASGLAAVALLARLEARTALLARGLRDLQEGQDAQRAAQGDARHELATQVAEARRALERVEADARARAERAQTLEAMVARIEGVMAGSHARGAAGEHAVGALLRQLPPELVARDVRLDGGVVEFALQMPDGKLLPVDVKWPAAPTMQRLAGANPEERTRLIAHLQREVEAKASEAARYLEPSRTCGLAVVALPDGVHALCDRAHAGALRRGVVLVPFSMVVPYLLAVWHLAHGAARTGDDARLAAAARAALVALGEASAEVEGRLARAEALLQNSRRALQEATARGEQALRGAVPDTLSSQAGGNQQRSAEEAQALLRR